jgi:biopolymer transport protein ExbD
MNGLTFRKKHRLPSEAGSAVLDLDVTPMMNVLIILIPYLISMAVFTHLAVIGFSLPPNVCVGLDAGGGTPTLKLTVVVAPDFVAITQGDDMLDSIPVAAGGYPYAVLRDKLVALRDSASVKDEIVVASRDGIQCKYLVRIMDSCREAGFSRLGLSSATVNPTGGL